MDGVVVTVSACGLRRITIEFPSPNQQLIMSLSSFHIMMNEAHLLYSYPILLVTGAWLPMACSVYTEGVRCQFREQRLLCVGPLWSVLTFTLSSILFSLITLLTVALTQAVLWLLHREELRL